ncbi:hypothetical protein [Kalamiella sp. sgz302252]|uniref:hypothetical protein n=1 Tax=Pantoea sp. sgz302252 TaxID=3341827 RepID=UPI0036D39540
MLADDDLARIYHQRSQQTLGVWREPATAATHTGFYPESLKAIATGIQPELSPSVRHLLAELGQQTRHDPLADTMQPDHFHLTFLAITPALYDRQRQPENCAGLKRLAAAYCLEQELTIRELRLVALPNQLLLAGIPDTADIACRAAFWNALQRSEWAELLRQRYNGSRQPPPFWHSTLLRYHASILPDYLQRFFQARSEQRYGEICGKIRLRLVSYNWSESEELA